MGAWGYTAFENDIACDWAYDLDRVEDLSVLRETIQRVLVTGRGVLDADRACEGLAACEVVARLNRDEQEAAASTETIDEWVASHRELDASKLIPLAVEAVDRILTPPSEILELWQESDFTNWRLAVQELRLRLID